MDYQILCCHIVAEDFGKLLFKWNFSTLLVYHTFCIISIELFHFFLIIQNIFCFNRLFCCIDWICVSCKLLDCFRERFLLFLQILTLSNIVCSAKQILWYQKCSNKTWHQNGQVLPYHTFSDDCLNLDTVELLALLGLLW